MLWCISQWFFFLPASSSWRGCFSNLLCEDLEELLEVKLTGVWVLLWLGSQSFHLADHPPWASSTCPGNISGSLPTGPHRGSFPPWVSASSNGLGICLPVSPIRKQQLNLRPHFSDRSKKNCYFFICSAFSLLWGWEGRPPRSLPPGIEIANLILALFQVNEWSIRGLYEENTIVVQGVVGSLHPFPFRVITEHWKADLYPHYRSHFVGVTSPRWKQLTQVSYLGEMRLGHLGPCALITVVMSELSTKNQGSWWTNINETCGFILLAF